MLNINKYKFISLFLTFCAVFFILFKLYKNEIHSQYLYSTCKIIYDYEEFGQQGVGIYPYFHYKITYDSAEDQSCFLEVLAHKKTYKEVKNTIFLNLSNLWKIVEIKEFDIKNSTVKEWRDIFYSRGYLHVTIKLKGYKKYLLTKNLRKHYYESQEKIKKTINEANNILKQQHKRIELIGHTYEPIQCKFIVRSIALNSAIYHELISLLSKNWNNIEIENKTNDDMSIDMIIVTSQVKRN